MLLLHQLRKNTMDIFSTIPEFDYSTHYLVETHNDKFYAIRCNKKRKITAELYTEIQRVLDEDGIDADLIVDIVDSIFDE